MKKVLCVFGTRPEAVKMAPLIDEIKKHKDLDLVICVTAQHRDMLDQAMDIFNIVPDYDLDIMKEGQTLTDITVNVLKGVEEVLNTERPDLVLVHGDTTTAMAAALAAFYAGIDVGHVEAGLRTYNIKSPYPEEINRQIIDRIAKYLFAPTEKNERNLIDNLNDGQKVIVTGNTVIDALKNTVRDEYSDENLDWASGSRMILMTMHRRENLGVPMKEVFSGIKKIIEEFPDVKIIYPVHLNPKIKKVAEEVLGGNNKIRLINPLGVVDFHNYMKKAYLIVSDSGGVQEEAAAMRKPVLVVRNTTERTEGIEAGVSRLIGTNINKIVEEMKLLLSDKSIYNKMTQAKNPYGDGAASGRIVNAILNG